MPKVVPAAGRHTIVKLQGVLNQPAPKRRGHVNRFTVLGWRALPLAISNRPVLSLEVQLCFQRAVFTVKKRDFCEIQCHPHPKEAMYNTSEEGAQG